MAPGVAAAKPIHLNLSLSLSLSLKWPDVQDDYVVRYEGYLIGRIRLGGERYGQGTRWEWSVEVPMAMPAWASGTAASRDASIKEFTAAWGRHLKETSPERLERAFEFERACLARQQTMGTNKTNEA